MATPIKLVRRVAGVQLCIALFCVIGRLAVAAQTSPAAPAKPSDFQSWDEVDFLTRLRPSLDVTWITRVRFSEELPNPAHYVFGTDWNFSAGKHLILTPSFYYG